MTPRISVVTLGVNDVARATRFYADGLGLPRHDFEGGIIFFTLTGTWLALYPGPALAADIGLEAAGKTAVFSGVTLAHKVASRQAVDRLLEVAVAAGARLARTGQSVFWGGYSGYFQDFEGHDWEIAYNPFEDLT